MAHKFSRNGTDPFKPSKRQVLRTRVILLAIVLTVIGLAIALLDWICRIAVYLSS